MSKPIFAPQVISAVKVIEGQLDVAEAGHLDPGQRAAVNAVRGSLTRAEAAAKGEKAHWNRVGNWWRGSQVESAYLHLHAARVAIVDVYGHIELEAEIPRAVARAQGGMHRDDPRRVAAAAFEGKDETSTRAILRRLVEDGYEATDMQHQRLRSFRNITLMASAAVTLLTIGVLAVVWSNPDVLPLCFEKPDGGAAGELSCPASNHATAASSQDVIIVALMGLLGGSLSAVFSLRNLRGTSVPYDVPVALAILKLPLGALTAVAGLVLVHGGFIPGLSNLDSQDQILAYALLFGIGQQAFTRLVDQKAQSLLEGLPSKDPEQSPGEPMTPASSAPSPSPTSAPATPGTSGAEASLEVTVVEGDPGEFDEVEMDDVLSNPEGDEGEQVQDDESDVISDVIVKDHT